VNRPQVIRLGYMTGLPCKGSVQSD